MTVNVVVVRHKRSYMRYLRYLRLEPLSLSYIYTCHLLVGVDCRHRKNEHTQPTSVGDPLPHHGKRYKGYGRQVEKGMASTTTSVRHGTDLSQHTHKTTSSCR